jgi:hypothetical protein
MADIKNTAKWLLIFIGVAAGTASTTHRGEIAGQSTDTHRDTIAITGRRTG